MATSPAGYALLVAVPLLSILLLPGALEVGDVPMLMVTAKVVNALTAPLTQLQTPWIVVPLLLIVMTGDLVWREREARIDEITDVTPVPEAVPFLGKFFGIAFLLVVWRGLLVLAGMVAQSRMGFADIDVALYLKTVVALQLPDYLLFTLLALTIHVVVNHKHLGYLAAIVADAVILAGPQFGLRHNLLRFGGGPAWAYTEMSGFGETLLPWLWFKLYWAAWAILLAVATRLLWIRGRESTIRTRLHLARQRFTGATAGVTALAVTLVLSLGGFIFYNTNVLNRFESPEAAERRQAEYERQYARFRGIPQPRVQAMRLTLDFYPERGGLALSGTYRLVNRSDRAIDSIHLSVATGTNPSVTLDRAASTVLVDSTLDYRIFELEHPLAPGDSTTLSFELHSERRGFGNDGIGSDIRPNGSFLLGSSWLPAIGYQWNRELNAPGVRQRHGLVERPVYPAPEDVAARSALRGEERMMFEAVVGTTEGQVAVAPGELRQQWNERGRSFFRYASDGPIWNDLRFMSARYTIAEDDWRNPDDPSQVVSLQVYHHPGHTVGIERMFRSAKAALTYHSREFGRFPHRHLRFVERPGEGGALHSEETLIDYLEEFSFFHPTLGPNGADLTFAAIAHEVAHQWWGSALAPAHVTGAPVLSESMAWYTAMLTIEQARGKDELDRLRAFFRQPTPISPVRTGATLMHALDPYLSYRKGPLALYALREYAGEDKVNSAIRTLLRQHPTEAVPMVTTIDLYRELAAEIPDSLQYLLHDYFQVNTFWEIKLREAKVMMNDHGTYDVALELDARKEVLDSAGISTDAPMNDLVEIILFDADSGGHAGKPSYRALHRIQGGRQT
ncbi:MAG TPA: M1 family aminopeptidase, partial [Gemmatimonadales bacterium]|nr:M1 family aminopeptidase [Gemmatimonadales bacterium]